MAWQTGKLAELPNPNQRSLVSNHRGQVTLYKAIAIFPRVSAVPALPAARNRSWQVFILRFLTEENDKVWALGGVGCHKGTRLEVLGWVCQKSFITGKVLCL